MKYYNKNIMKIFALLTIPVIILWASLVFINIQRENQLIIDNAMSELEINNKSKSTLLENYLSKKGLTERAIFLGR